MSGTVEWLTIASSLASGLLGVVLGSVITLKERDREEDRLNRGAARVTYVELAENISYIKGAMKHRITMPLMTRTWPETRTRLAATLSPTDFAKLARSYAEITAMQKAWQDRPLGSGGIGSNTLEITRNTLARVEEASLILLAKGWTDPADREIVSSTIHEA
jgi:hypothetical protein